MFPLLLSTFDLASNLIILPSHFLNIISLYFCFFRVIGCCDFFVIVSRYTITMRSIWKANNFQQAYRHKLYGPHVQWLLPGWYTKDWWRVADVPGCSAEDIRTAAANFLAVEDLVMDAATNHTLSGLVRMPLAPNANNRCNHE